VKIIAFQLSLFCKNYRFSKTVLYIINRKIHGCFEIPDLFLDIMFNTRNKSGISAHPCIILYLTRNNSSWVFSEPEKQVCRFTMASRSKSFIFLHVVEDEQREVMDIWCTSGLRRVRRDLSITRGGLDADQWWVRLSMRSPTVYGKNICDVNKPAATCWQLAAGR
jgi:hypothetical protein